MKADDMIIGNQVICIYNQTVEKITIGKKYTIVEFDSHMNWIRIINDEGKVEWYSIIRFLSMDECRDNKLKELGI
jgi:hypothetical protein